MTKPNVPNAQLAYQVLDHIRAHPEEWTQQEWACDTRACFAGWAVTADAQSHGLDVRFGTRHSGGYVLIAGKEFNVRDAAMQALGIDHFQASMMFSGVNGLADLEKYVLDFFGPRPEDVEVVSFSFPALENEVVTSKLPNDLSAPATRAAIKGSPPLHLDLEEDHQSVRLFA